MPKKNITCDLLHIYNKIDSGMEDDKTRPFKILNSVPLSSTIEDDFDALPILSQSSEIFSSWKLSEERLRKEAPR